ncbi:MAG: hypothetical protein FJ025_01060 [Chloroflexi bacterium]|nr:hypothetical protein [Chloroflexota bacterium]
MKKSKIALGLAAILVITALLITSCASEPTPTQPTTKPPTTTPVETLSEILGRAASVTSAKFDLVMTAPGAPAVVEKMWVKGNKIRVETEMEGQPLVIIQDRDAQALYMYIPAQNTATKTELEAETESIEQFSPAEVAKYILDSKPVATGTETVDGKACLVIEFTGGDGQKLTAWVWKEYGFPIKVEGSTPEGKAILEWQNIELSSIPDSMFVLPAGVIIDDTVPVVSSVFPDNNASDIMVNTAITATFSEPMNADTITTTTFTLMDNDNVISGEVIYTDTTATFIPSADLDYSTTYIATITNEARDQAGNAMSTDYTWNFTTRDAGILEGALNYTGPYPAPADVSYRDTDGQIATVTAYPGQVQVFFDSATSLSEAEASIQANGGTIIGKIPLTGYYLVQVSEGTEDDFITAIQQDSRVKISLPNLALALEQDGVLINEDFITKSIPVPLNITGPVAIDSGTHAQDVLQSAQANGAPINHVVGLTNILDDRGNFSADKIAFTLTAIVQGNSIFNPGKLAYVNMSNGAGAQLNGNWVDYTTLSTPQQQTQAINNWKNAILTKVQGVNMLPDELKSQLAISQSAGNCNMPIAQPLQEIRNEHPELVPILRDNFTIYATTLAGTPDASYPTGKFSNYAPGDKDVVTINNPQAVDGTSLAAPAGLAYTMQAASEAGGLTAAQANMAIKLAAYTNATGQLNLDEAIEIANNVKSTSENLLSYQGVTEEQATMAMWLAVETNANHDLVPEEALDKLSAIYYAGQSDSPMAMYVTSIAFTSVGAVTGAVITPAIAGVTIQYTVSGTDGYYDSGSLQTDASGRVSFSIPPGACEVTDTISVSAVLSGKSITTTYTWWY